MERFPKKIGEHHSTLGLSYPATPEQLKQAKKELALKWHPDKNPGDKHAEKMMKSIFNAHDELVKFYKDHAHKRFMGATGDEKDVAERERREWEEYEKNPQKFADDLFTDLFHPGRRRGW